jgi:sulfide:quinone oxidoreductase
MPVLIAGGGVAGLEALMALRDLAGDRVQVTVLSAEPDFVLKPLSVGEPFSVGHVRRFPLAEVVGEHDAQLQLGALRAVRPEQHTVLTASGTELPYEVLLLAVGGQPYPPYARALTFGMERDPYALNGVLADIEGGYSKSVAFVVAPGVTWPMPLYELALMTARETWSMGIDDARLMIVSPEASPLAVFGPEASVRVGELLEAAGVEFVGGAYADVDAGGQIRITPGERDIHADRIVTLPLLDGPRIVGVPRDHGGFTPIDEHARVIDLADVYAAGDGTNFPIKQGGLATQEADAAAEHIAQRAGAPVDPRPFRPVLRGKLMTGGPEPFFRSAIAGGGGEGQVSEQPLWWPPTKISGHYLHRWLFARDPAIRALAPPEAGSHVDVTDVEVPLSLDHEEAVRAAMALDPLGPLPSHYRYVPGPAPTH